MQGLLQRYQVSKGGTVLGVVFSQNEEAALRLASIQYSNKEYDTELTVKLMQSTVHTK